MGVRADWLANSGVAVALRETPWAIPAIQCVHIAAIALLISSSVLAQMRIAGWMAVDQPLDQIASWVQPRLRLCIAVLLATGLLMILSEPNRTLGNPAFWAKMGAVISAFGLTEIQVRFAHSGGAFPGWGRPAAFVVLMLWIVAIACGRWIAYLY
ncbi:DUF6644 family protein [Novosphingobium humi]|uniref:DUF6644 family protein n=1 Tax=Novosphingobium humi TaxID=2282397 RepID=UPI0025B120F8|nr:DUF6644 family protein [Novosphingobium humi]WJT01173.1 hypothetical protein NYQ05_20665 [Novosphingobium humi]